jgi:crotonobetainyl-CoA:carnitine CoA-transferase CaiB-like acyl-CoA transferase
VPEPPGNRATFGDCAPHGIYPCAGEDAWIAIACRDDVEWSAAASVLGLRGPASWDTLAGRLADLDALDAAIASATGGCDRFELMERLQAAGVPAGPVMTAQDLVERNPHLAQREFFGTAESERFGTYGLDRFPALFDGARPARYDGPVAAGTDTFDVLASILGMDDEAIAELMAEGALT